MKYQEIKQRFVFKRFKTSFFRWFQMWTLDDDYYDDLIEEILKYKDGEGVKHG